jgi:hypothetical protein
MAGTPISVPAGATPPAVPSGSLTGPFPSPRSCPAPRRRAGPVPDSWYYCCSLPGGTVQIRQVSPADPAPCQGGITVQGPFMSLAEAQTYCQGGRPCRRPPPRRPRQPVFTPGGETWSCYEEPSGGKYIALTSAVPNVPGTVRTAGPFATYAEAYAVCGSPAVPAAPIPTFPCRRLFCRARRLRRLSPQRRCLPPPHRRLRRRPCRCRSRSRPSQPPCGRVFPPRWPGAFRRPALRNGAMRSTASWSFSPLSGRLCGGSSMARSTPRPTTSG